jgi:hypothetical protein
MDGATAGRPTDAKTTASGARALAVLQPVPQATADASQAFPKHRPHFIDMRLIGRGIADCTKAACVAIGASGRALVRPTAGNINATANNSKNNERAITSMSIE